MKKIDHQIGKKNTQHKYLYVNHENKGFKNIMSLKGKIVIKTPEDVSKLTNFPCLQSTDYTGSTGHSQRWAIGNILFWCGLSLSEIVKSFKLIVKDFDENITRKQLQSMLGSDRLPKYVITCEYMKKNGLCKGCDQKFYTKINLKQEYWAKLDLLHK